jgi:cobaltochelatase CobS
MPYGIATKDGLCEGWSDNTRALACGKAFTAGVDKVTWAPSIEGKYMHSECYFKTKAFKDAQAKREERTAHNGGNGHSHVASVTIEDEGSVTQKPHTPAMTGNGDILGILASAILPMIKDEVKAKVDPKQIESQIETAVKAAIQNHSRTIVVNDKAANETREIKGLTHRQYPELLAIVNTGLYPYMYDDKETGNIGGPGAGKTTAAHQVSEALNRQFGHISLNMQTSPSAILGYMDAHGKYVRTPFRDAYENGHVFLFDELDNANGNLLTSLNTALANGSMAFPDGIIIRHDNFVCIAAGNTAGRGANAMHNSRQVLDEASRERFVFLGWGYDEELERKAALAYNKDANAWVTWIQKVRNTVASLGLRLVVSPRASINGAKLLKTGLNTKEIANAVLFKGIDADTKAKVLASNPLR